MSSMARCCTLNADIIYVPFDGTATAGSDNNCRKVLQVVNLMMRTHK